MFFVLYILRNSLLSDVSFENSHSQAMAYLLILSMLSFCRAEVFNFKESQFISYFFHRLCF